ncbi:MAG: hypothetical protein UW69_C0018G0003 [Microgenomates group bacterium GW2011_GWA2_44_7]|nr:MAG: hypothetical protein UW69_C0018G0003 [Microgenomates group bacterium GW2011_GWA2_44_7]KKW02812.1 MAG: hypothetical protein UY36_C0001G0004 [Parcubacteria group bacterium GW2011_GWA1_49_11]
MTRSVDRKGDGWTDLWSERKKSFSLLYPGGVIDAVSFSAVPGPVWNHFEAEAEMFIYPKNYIPRDFLCSLSRGSRRW